MIDTLREHEHEVIDSGELVRLLMENAGRFVTLYTRTIPVLMKRSYDGELCPWEKGQLTKEMAVNFQPLRYYANAAASMGVVPGRPMNRVKSIPGTPFSRNEGSGEKYVNACEFNVLESRYIDREDAEADVNPRAWVRRRDDSRPLYMTVKLSNVKAIKCMGKVYMVEEEVPEEARPRADIRDLPTSALDVLAQGTRNLRAMRGELRR